MSADADSDVVVGDPTATATADNVASPSFAMMDGFDFSGLDSVRAIAKKTEKIAADLKSNGITELLQEHEDLHEAQNKFIQMVEETKGYVEEKGGPVDEVEAAAMDILRYNLRFHEDNLQQGNISSSIFSVFYDAAGDLKDFADPSLRPPGAGYSLRDFYENRYEHLEASETNTKKDNSVEARSEDDASTPNRQNKLQIAGKVAGAAAALGVAGKFTADLIDERQELDAEKHPEGKKTGKSGVFAKVAMVALGVTIAGGFVASLMGKDVAAPFRNARNAISSRR